MRFSLTLALFTRNFCLIIFNIQIHETYHSRGSLHYDLDSKKIIWAEIINLLSITNIMLPSVTFLLYLDKLDALSDTLTLSQSNQSIMLWVTTCINISIKLNQRIDLHGGYIKRFYLRWSLSLWMYEAVDHGPVMKTTSTQRGGLVTQHTPSEDQTNHALWAQLLSEMTSSKRYIHLMNSEKNVHLYKKVIKLGSAEKIMSFFYHHGPKCFIVMRLNLTTTNCFFFVTASLLFSK